MAQLPQARFSRSPLTVLAAALCLGIVTAHFLAPQEAPSLIRDLAIGAGITTLLASFVLKKKLATSTGLIMASCFCAGLVLSLIETNSNEPNRIAGLFEAGVIASGEPVELTGLIAGQPELAPGCFYLTLQAEAIRFKGVERQVTGTISLLAPVSDQRMRKEYDTLELRHGARVHVMTALDREADFRNPGVLPFTEYLERKGYDATGVIKSPLLIETVDDARVFLPLAWLYQWRECLEKEFGRIFSPETAGVLDAALLGNRYNVPHAVADRFRAGGTFHILVIAGLHISFIGGVVFMVVRWLTKRRRWQFILAVLFLWSYTIAVGAHTPVVRAALMFTLVVFAPIVSRRANSLNVIGGAMFALLAWRPNDLFDPSFQLSFLSVLAIVALAAPLLRKMQQIGSWRPTRETPYPPACSSSLRALSEALFWSEQEWRADLARSSVSYRLFKTSIAARLERWHVQKLFRFAFAAVIVSASVQLVMLPLLVIYFHRVSPASLVLNIFVGGLMATLALVAMAAVLVSQISMAVSWPLIMLAEKVNWTMIHLVDPFMRLGTASIRLPHYTGWPAGVYVFYYLPLGLFFFALFRWNPLRPVTIPKSKVFLPGKLRFAAMALVGALAVIVWHPFSAPPPDGKLHADFLDVGQGDSALLTMPDGTTLLLDGGGRPNTSRDGPDEDAQGPFERDTRSIGEGVVSEFLWARGLDRIDYLLATHADADHIDGLNDVARNFSVRGAIVARAPADDPEFARFATTMEETGVPVHKIGAGDVLHFGNVAAQVLWPPSNPNANAPSRNNDSVILRVRLGERALILTGDIEKEGEAEVLKEGLDLHGDVVKVAHHGSKTSSAPAFVNATLPSLAIISVGRTSIFGHPSKEVVDRWRASGAEVMTTGQRGTITVVTDGRILNVSTFVR